MIDLFIICPGCPAYVLLTAVIICILYQINIIIYTPCISYYGLRTILVQLIVDLKYNLPEMFNKTFFIGKKVSQMTYFFTTSAKPKGGGIHPSHITPPIWLFFWSYFCLGCVIPTTL